MNVFKNVLLKSIASMGFQLSQMVLFKVNKCLSLCKEHLDGVKLIFINISTLCNVCMFMGFIYWIWVEQWIFIDFQKCMTFCFYEDSQLWDVLSSASFSNQSAKTLKQLVFNKREFAQYFTELEMWYKRNVRYKHWLNKEQCQ